MSYRDELDAAHARISALEQDLKQAERERDEARGTGRALAVIPAGAQALVRADAGGKHAPRWLGAPVQLGFERVLDGEVPASAYTEMIERMRRAFGSAGTTTVLPGSLAWSLSGGSNSMMPMVNIYVTSRDGTTRITLEQRLAATVGAIFGGVGGGVGGGGVGLPIVAAMISPFAVPFAIGVWLGGVYALCRRLYRSRARFHADRLDKLVGELADIATAHLSRPAPVSAR